MKTISITDLKSQQDTATLIHVLPKEHFEREHLPGALNACVYETVFPSKVAELIPAKSTAIIVYGDGGPSYVDPARLAGVALLPTENCPLPR